MTKAPDQEAFERDLKKDGPYHMGINDKWRLFQQGWPECIFQIRARCGKWWGIKVNLTGYPDSPPRGALWDCEKNTALQPNDLPQGGLIPSYDDGIDKTFRSQYPSLYSPFDGAWLGQKGWATQHPQYAWNPERTISFYLEQVYELLNSRGYRPPENPQAEAVNP